MKPIEFFVHGEPKTQGSMRAFISKSTGRPIVINDSAKTKPWRQQVSTVALQHREEGVTPYGGPVSVALLFYVPRPKGHYKKDGALKPSAPMHPITRGLDADKAARCILDAISAGVIVVDDSQVCQLAVGKGYADARQPPGVQVAIFDLATMPVAT